MKLRFLLLLSLLLVSLSRAYNEIEEVIEGNCDIVVLGAGTAGSVVASIASENEDKTVCLLERGKDESQGRYTVVTTLNNLVNDAADGGLAPIEKLTTEEPFTTPGFAECYYPFAQGGGPAVSASIHGCSEEQYWNLLANLTGSTKFLYNNAMPVFRANENVDLTQTDFAGRGTSGPVQVSFVDKNDPAIAGFKFVMAASFGVSERTDYCHPDGMNGFFPFQLSIKRGSCNATSGPCVRQDTFTTYVKPYLQTRSNLYYLADAQVNKIIFNNNANRLRANKVNYVYKGKEYEIKIKDQLVVSLGSMNTPKLLQLSGVGDADLLNSLDITVVKDLKGVGRNLRDHTVMTVAYYNPLDTTINDARAPFAGFVKSGFNGNFTDIEIPCGIFPTRLFRVLPAGSPGAIYLCYIVQVKNVSIGTLNIQSTVYNRQANISLGIDPAWMNATIWALNVTRNAFRAIGFPAIAEAFPGEAVLPINSSFEAVRAFVAQNVGPWHHVAGSCRMGPESDPMNVVDTNQKVHGIRNLYIADTSIYPEVPPTHPSTMSAFAGRLLGTYLRDL